MPLIVVIPVTGCVTVSVIKAKTEWEQIIQDIPEGKLHFFLNHIFICDDPCYFKVVLNR